ncbi:hypothetical protein [Burkholderia sp. SIMBA_062]|uniref:hypothetical protein n=1 Tax=Burkholderia sp. SIMBA_062 TaxID=3085803 RepID=UPI00397E14C5
MKSSRQLRRITSFAVACVWSIPVLMFAGYILWNLVPFFQGDENSRMAYYLRTASYFAMRAISSIWTREWSFLPIRFDDLNFAEWGILYISGLVTDLSLASLVLQIGTVIANCLEIFAFKLAFRVRRSRGPQEVTSISPTTANTTSSRPDKPNRTTRES